MDIVKRYFPEIMLDNDSNYIAQLTGVIESVDEFAAVEITKLTDGIMFRIATSLPKYTQAVLQEVLTLNNLLGIRLDLSKSIKSSGSLVFKIKTD